MVDACDCGREVGPADRFCPSCGRRLDGTGGSARADAPAGPDGSVVDLLRGFVGQQVADRITLEGGRPVEERRLVTALFADLSGFATLAGRLDAEDLQDVVDPVLSGLARIVARYDGYVEKFSGDALLALFGAPLAHEDDATRALHAALDMQAELPGLVGGQVAEPLRLHIGVTTGTVVARTIGSTARMDYAVLGESVVLAQRLQAAAGSGEVYVGAPTRELVGEEFAFADLGALQVKGRAAPLPAFRLLGLGSGWSDAGPLVGRDHEQAVLLECLARVRQGDGVVVRLTGPPGSGKSRLLAALRHAAQAEGLPVVELLGAVHLQSPYHSLLPLVSAALERRYPDPDPADVLDRVAADEAAPAPQAVTAVLAGRSEAGGTLGSLPPVVVRRQLDGAARAWLTDLAATGPAVLVADALHRLDAASREVVEQLAADPVPGVLLSLGGREAGEAPGAGEVHLELGPLGAEAVRELVAAELGLVPDDRLLAHVAEHGDGTPLMVRETARQLQREGLLDEQHGFARLVAGGRASSVPANLDGMVAARLDALPPAAAAVATVAAVVGLVVDRDLLRRVSGLDADACAAQVAELERAGVLRPALTAPSPGAPAVERFDSALVRDVLYARLTARRRRQLHARVADALGDPAEPTDEVVALLAEHRYLAGDLAEALPWLTRAATHARRLLAQDTAVVALTRAVDAARTVAPDLLPGLLTELGDVRAERGEHERARALYAEARALGNDARAWAGDAAVLRRQGRYADALALLDAAVAAQPAGDARLLALERSWAASVSGDLEGSVVALLGGLEAGDPSDGVAGRLLLQLVRAETLLGDLGAARQHAGRAIGNLQRAGDSAGLCTALRLLGSLQQTAGELEAAATTLTEGLLLATRSGLVEEIGGCRINLGLVHADRGDHRAAEESYRLAAVTFEQAGIEAGRAMAYGNRGYELFLLGEHEQARTLAILALGLAEQVGNQLTAADVHHTLGLIAEATGDPATALDEAEAAVAGFERAGLPDAAAPSRLLAARCRT